MPSEIGQLAKDAKSAAVASSPPSALTKARGKFELASETWLKALYGEEEARRILDTEGFRGGKHATHGQGPGYYGEWNASRLDREASAERTRGIGHGFHVARSGLPEDEASRRRAMGYQRPYFWSSRLYGEPHGEWETPVLERGGGGAEHPHPLVLADPDVVYSRAGGRWRCHSCSKLRPEGQMHHCRRCWEGRQKSYDLCDHCWVQLRVDRSKGCTLGRLEELEWEIRDSICELRERGPNETKLRHGRHEPPRVVLCSVLAQADQGKLLGLAPHKSSADAAVYRRALLRSSAAHEALNRSHAATMAVASSADFVAGCNGLISAENLRYLLAQRLGINLTKQEARAILAKYGVDDEELLPYEVFARSLFAGPARQLAQNGFRRGPLDPTMPSTWAVGAMLKYPQCRKAIAPPTNWDGTLARRSCTAPPRSAAPRLEHVAGYAGRGATCGNLFFTQQGQAIYHVAQLCVIYDIEESRQHFFRGHNGVISAIALDPTRRLCATGQRAVAESVTKVALLRGGPGDNELKLPVSHIGTKPSILVWDVLSRAVEQKLILGDGDFAVAALGFSHDGVLLAAVGADNEHLLHVWRWREGQKVLQEKVVQGGEWPQENEQTAPRPKIYGVHWNAYRRTATGAEIDIVTFGNGHLALWEIEQTTRLPWEVANRYELTPSGGGDVHAAVLLPTAQLLSAGSTGMIVLWAEAGEDGWLQVQNFKGGEAAHGGAPVCALCEVVEPMESTETDESVTPLARLVSGGGDGTVRLWRLEVATEVEPEMKGEGVSLMLVEAEKRQPQPGPPPERWVAPEDGSGGSGGVLRPPPPRRVVSVDMHSESGAVLCGDDCDDIWLLDAVSDGASGVEAPLLCGLGGEAQGIATHPCHPSLYVACSADGVLLVGDSLLRTVLVRRALRRGSDIVGPTVRLGEGEALRPWTVGFSADGTLLVVATAGVVGDEGGVHPDQGGGFCVFRFEAQALRLAAEKALAEATEARELPLLLEQELRGWELQLLCEKHEQEHLLTLVEFSPDGTLLAVAGHERVIDLYRVPQLAEPDGLQGLAASQPSTWLELVDEKLNGEAEWRRVARCSGHSATVLHLDWSVDSAIFQTSSADYDLLTWDRRGRQLTTNQRNCAWATQRVPLGWEVMGIWAEGMNDAMTITATDRSPCGKYLLTADDGGAAPSARLELARRAAGEQTRAVGAGGCLRLLHYPAVVKHAPALEATGHGSFVTAARFSSDGSCIVSAGGNDRALMQWGVALPKARRSGHIRAKWRAAVLTATGWAPPAQTLQRWEVVQANKPAWTQLQQSMTAYERLYLRQQEIRRLAKKLRRQKQLLTRHEAHIEALREAARRGNGGCDTFYDRSTAVMAVYAVRRARESEGGVMVRDVGKVGAAAAVATVGFMDRVGVEFEVELLGGRSAREWIGESALSVSHEDLVSAARQVAVTSGREAQRDKLPGAVVVMGHEARAGMAQRQWEKVGAAAKVGLRLGQGLERQHVRRRRCRPDPPCHSVPGERGGGGGGGFAKGSDEARRHELLKISAFPESALRKLAMATVGISAEALRQAEAMPAQPLLSAAQSRRVAIVNLIVSAERAETARRSRLRAQQEAVDAQEERREVVAVATHAATNAYELSFEAGARLALLEDGMLWSASDELWLVRDRQTGKRGLAPAQCLELV